VVFSFKRKKKERFSREKEEKEGKKKSFKEAKVAQIVFGPLLAHYLYLAFVVLFQTKAYFSP